MTAGRLDIKETFECAAMVSRQSAFVLPPLAALLH